MQPLSSLGNGLFEGDTEFYLQVFFLFYFLSITSWSITWISLQFRYFSTLNREKQVNDHKLRFHFWPDSQTVLEQIQRNLLQWTLNLHKVEQTGWSCLSLWALLLSAAVHQPESWNYSWSLPSFSWPAWECQFSCWWPASPFLEGRCFSDRESLLKQELPGLLQWMHRHVTFLHPNEWILQ